MTIKKITSVCLLIWCIFVSSCGGGGSSGQSQQTSTLKGQVVKGLVSNAKVTLYSVSDRGQKSIVSEATTDREGSFSFATNLVGGNVYLLEAIDGTYQNEISDVTETLKNALRAVFVAESPQKNQLLLVFFPK